MSKIKEDARVALNEREALFEEFEAAKVRHAREAKRAKLAHEELSAELEDVSSSQERSASKMEVSLKAARENLANVAEQKEEFEAELIPLRAFKAKASESLAASEIELGEVRAAPYPVLCVCSSDTFWVHLYLPLPLCLAPPAIPSCGARWTGRRTS